MANWKKWLIFWLGLIVFSIVVGNLVETRIKKYQVDRKSEQREITPTIGQKLTAKVVRVVDGDTIEIEGGQKVRYIGIDTPETVDPKKPVECFGKEASAKNKELVEGKIVELEKDISETDRYGRLLRYVWIDGQMVNELLVKTGYARLETVPPDIKYSELLANEEKQARETSQGLWNQCQ